MTRKDGHVAQMRFGGQVTFETVGVSALLLAELAVEFEFLQAFGFHAIGNVFGGSLFGFGHFFISYFASSREDKKGDERDLGFSMNVRS